MNWAVFSRVYDLLAVPLIAGVDAMIAAMTGWIGPNLRLGLIVFLVGWCLWKALTQDQEPLSGITRVLVLGTLAISMVGASAGYTPWARDVLLNGISQGVGGALAGALGNRPITGMVFDEIWLRAWAAGLAVYESLPWSIAGFGLVLLVVLYWLMCLASIALAFLIWLKAFAMLALLIGVGPIFAGLFIFPLFRGLAIGWLNTVLTSIVLQILTAALLALLLTVQGQLVTEISAGLQSGVGSNEFESTLQLLGALLVFALSGWIAYQLPGVAASIAHGFAAYPSTLIGRWRGGRGGGGGDRPPPPPPPPSDPGKGSPSLPPPPPAAPVGRNLSTP